MRILVLSSAIIATVFLGLLIITAIVGTVLYFAGKPGSGVRRVGGALSLICGTLVAIVVALGVTSVTVYSARQDVAYPAAESTDPDVIVLQMPIQQPVHARPMQNERLTTQPTTNGTDGPQQKSVAEAKAIEPADAVTPQDDRTAREDLSEPRPSWTQQPETRHGDVGQFVITSKQFATVEAARDDVAATAKEMLRKDFERIYRVTASHIGDLSTDVVRHVAVREEFVETIQRDFGNFYAPMHRVWWQLEISPDVRSHLFPLWKARTQEARLLILAGTLVGVTLGLAGISLLLRRRKPMPPPISPPTRASAIVLGLGAATLAAKHCRNWWNSRRSCR